MSALLGQQNDRFRALKLISVSRETEIRLKIFVDLLVRWQRATNLISAATLTTLWTRHIADSAQLLSLAPTALRWVDVGTGAGFPGVVVAILLADLHGAVVHCIESDHSKCTFLREIARATSAPAIIYPTRAQSLNQSTLGNVDAVTARALAPLHMSLGIVNKWLALGATGMLAQGRSFEKQLDKKTFRSTFIVDVVPSIVDMDATILRIRVR
jgi:16S rRNA (guanine527-N7)-methyltransferase